MNQPHRVNPSNRSQTFDRNEPKEIVEAVSEMVRCFYDESHVRYTWTRRGYNRLLMEIWLTMCDFMQAVASLLWKYSKWLNSTKTLGLCLWTLRNTLQVWSWLLRITGHHDYALLTAFNLLWDSERIVTCHLPRGSKLQWRDDIMCACAT